MLGILVLLIVSLGLAWLAGDRKFGFLGLDQPTMRAGQAGWGLGVAAVIAIVAHTASVALKSGSWSMAEGASAGLLASSAWWDVVSVVTEELVFRGLLLFLLIRWIGAGRAVLVSAAAFGVYHLFSMGVFGPLIPMLFVFFGTGLAGYAWALAYARTGSIILPVAMHLGWNVAQNTLLSRGPLGETLFVASVPEGSPVGIELTAAITVMFIAPALMIWLVCKRWPAD